jgi:hypothetical protein
VPGGPRRESPRVLEQLRREKTLRTLNIVAASPESARALINALSDFDAELIDGSDGGFEVTVRLGGDHTETIAVLNALSRFVTQRERSARVTLDGREYVMLPDPVK